MDSADTIFALSSGKLPSGVAIIRVSGPKVRFVLETVFGRVPTARSMEYGLVCDLDGSPIDRGLAVFFPLPASFTGEDCAEFHVHGGIAGVRALAAALSFIDGVRQAEAGEFTRRAFFNGKLDLTQAEGLGDLINAETEAQRKLALMQVEGGIRRLYEDWRARLVNVRAFVEAAIDFSEEEDVEAIATNSAFVQLAKLRDEISRHLSGSIRSEIVRDGYKVVIIGAPNSGKSTFLNAIAGRDVSIATDEPGTTRDLIDVRLDLGGNLVVVTDTAGIRESPGRVESIGIERALARARSADLVLLLHDVGDVTSPPGDLGAAPVLRVGSKSDLSTGSTDRFDYVISSVTGDGLELLLDRIRVEAELGGASSELFVIQDRQRRLLELALDDLRGCFDAGLDLEILAEHLRSATDSVGRLTGRVDVEELLGVVFSKFCIGK